MLSSTIDLFFLNQNSISESFLALFVAFTSESSDINRMTDVMHGSFLSAQVFLEHIGELIRSLFYLLGSLFAIFRFISDISRVLLGSQTVQDKTESGLLDGYKFLLLLLYNIEF